ncbi:AMP-binding protein [Salinicola rhizosphaerae]|uniref:AMP-binding protein n=1 Tax=Salinicola rhizosphaerae TaxID=1443141 RepID=A0ABQ3DTR0_9GAMM|nr:AMP-binding protein [Salinicola rhizosphaerae]GHB16108.1 AMP-binding protein [Salinicola rhizosphaerae]
MSFLELRERPWRQRATTDTVAWYPATPTRPQGWLSIAEWHLRIGAWQRLLDTFESTGQRTWLLFEPDPVEFSAALIAIWERGDEVLLPADNQPETVASLAHAGVALGAIAGAGSAGEDQPPIWGDEPLPENALSLYTSGSTGEPQRLTKRFAQLDAEMATHATLWPLAQRVVISQVSHQHIYGLFFSLLRPICEGAPFAARLCPYPETLHAWLGELQADRGVLISAPPALSRLAPAMDWSPVTTSLARIHSSGAPLPKAASDDVRQQLGTPVFEVYGSSETGGIGWRDQQHGDEWTPLPGVEVRTDDDHRLWLRSPHLDAPNAWQRQADCIALTSTGFVLEGRADRIVKIGGKRVSLTAVDRALESQPEVVRAQTLPLQRRDLRLAAIVQLSAETLPHDHATHRATVQRLRRALAARFEAQSLPRYWRFVTDWPSNAQGKLSAEIRRRLFLDLDDRRAPRWLGEHIEDGAWRLTLEVPEHCAYLDGHFDGQPVLPGVALIHWTMQAAQRLLGAETTFAGVERLRFPTLLLPGDRFEMTLEHRLKDGQQSLRVQCLGQRGEHMSGRVLLYVSDSAEDNDVG